MKTKHLKITGEIKNPELIASSQLLADIKLIEDFDEANKKFINEVKEVASNCYLLNKKNDSNETKFIFDNFQVIFTNENLLTEILDKIILVFEKLSSKNNLEISNFKKLFLEKNNPLTSIQLFNSLINLEENSVINNFINKDNINFFSIFFNYLVRPIFISIKDQIVPNKFENSLFDDEIASNNKCPICGSSPSLGFIDEDGGRRYLWCHLCDTKWHFQRIQCVNCKSIDQEKLNTINIENDTIFRIQTCEECKGYIKEIRGNLKKNLKEGSDKKESLNLIEFDKFYLGLSYLDFIANEKGYENV